MESPSLSPEDRLVQRSDVETRPYDKGAMLVDMGSGRCYRLNVVGAEVWALLREPRALVEVCGEIERRYGVTPETAMNDVLALVEHLLGESLLRALPEGATP